MYLEFIRASLMRYVIRRVNLVIYIFFSVYIHLNDKNNYLEELIAF
jgi:hypothetical protein